MSALKARLKKGKATSSSAASVKYTSQWVQSSAPTTTTSRQRLSEDHRRRHEDHSRQRLPSPVKRRKTGHDWGDETLDAFDDPVLAQALEDPPETVIICDPEDARRKRRKRKVWESDEPMRDMRARMDQFVQALLYNEGRGDASAWPCPGCLESGPGTSPPIMRCEGCYGGSLYCEACCIREHRRRPFCRLERWNGVMFERVSLKDLGHRIQLGHPDHEACPSPRRGVAEFTIVHVNGLHTCSVDFCACANALKAGDDIDQLLRRGLFPATARDPQTCCTFEVLKHYTALSLQGKTTQYDYYMALDGQTDMTGTTGVKDRYKSFTRCGRLWRACKSIKRSGAVNTPDRRVDNIALGAIAVPCPACPIPSVNLPPDWADAPLDKQFLYTKTICLDACFRLKRRQVSSWERDPALTDGRSYLVESTPFEAHIKKEGKDQQEISTCHGLSALEHANTKFSRGYAETGKVIGVCARHEFVQKNGVVATQVGERYINTDYALASILSHHDEKMRFILSYDICCQYSKNLVDRMANMPEGLRRKLDVSRMRFVIPKLHIHGHKLECQLAFNLNYTLAAARTDGEGVERPWSLLGPLGTALRAMGPGSAADMLNDHIGFMNFVKKTGLGRLLRRRAIDALEELAYQSEELRAFTVGQAEYVGTWAKTVLEFERDPTAFNPFELPKTGLSEADVQLELATEDEEKARRGLNRGRDMSASAVVVAALQVEHEQRVLRMEVAAHRYSSTVQQTELAKKRTKLANTISNLREHQAVYCPGAMRALALWNDDPKNALAPIEKQPLFLPSSLPAAERATCVDGVDDIERRLRDAQCRTALEAVRNHLLVMSRMLTFKNANTRHQGPSTRAQGSLNIHKEKLHAFAHKYVDARAALLALSSDDADAPQWRALDLSKDLRCMQDPGDSRRGTKRSAHGDEEEGEAARSHLQSCREATGEGRRVISWIWTGVDTTGKEGGAMYEGLRVEWCKAFSRVRRWSEEVPLLQEEMRRVLVTLEHTASQWDALQSGDRRSNPQGEGARAYAASQAAVNRSLAAHFENMWVGLREGSKVDTATVIALREKADAEEDAEVEGGAGAEEEEPEVVGDEEDDEDDEEA